MSGEISRQTFVRRALGGVVGAALLGSCRSIVPEAASIGPDWDALDAALDGRVIVPSAADYSAAKGIFNTRFAGSAPAAVVAVTSVADVAKAVVFAVQNQLGVSVRSGGHSYIGASAADGALVLDMRRLPGGITYDANTELATISPAADLGFGADHTRCAGPLDSVRQLPDRRRRRVDAGRWAGFRCATGGADL